MTEIGAGEHLTCVWSAIAFLREEDNNKTADQIPSSHLEEFLVELSQNCRYGFTKFQFRTCITDGLVCFSNFKEYMLLMKGQTEFMAFLSTVREFCWQKIRDKLSAKFRQSLTSSSTEEDANIAQRRIWDVINLHMETTYPPRLSRRGANGIIHQLLLISGKEEEEPRWKIGPEAPWLGNWEQIFPVLNNIKGAFKNEKLTLFDIVGKLYRRGIDEVLAEGFLYVNLKQGHNMFGWSKQYAVLSPLGLSCYKNEDQTASPIYTISFETDLKFSEERNVIGFFRYLSFCWKITNSKDQTTSVLLSGKDEKLREEWMEKSRKIYSCLKRNTTPYADLLHESLSSSEIPRNNLIRLEADIRKTVLQHPHHLAEEEGDEEEEEEEEEERKKVSFVGDGGGEAPEHIERIPSIRIQRTPSIRIQRTPSMRQRSEFMRKKIHGLFVKHDNDGDGFLNSDEFRIMLSEFNLKLSKNDAENLFDRIKNHRIRTTTENPGASISNEEEKLLADKISCTAFHAYLTNLAAIETQGGDSIADYKIKMLIMRGETSGEEGKFNFKEILEYVGERNHDQLQERFQNLFEELSEDASKESLTNFFKKNKNRQTVADVLDIESETTDTELSLLAEINEDDVAEAKHIIKQRWEAFKSFKRQNRGVTVMAAPGDIKADLLPGEWSLMDLVMAQFEDDENVSEEPRYTEVDDVTWIPAKKSEAHGQIVFPPHFDGEIKVDIATNQNLGFYGCCIADKSQEKIVTLLYRHGTQDFTYSAKYLEEYVTAAGGGAGIERHMFDHMDCPMDDDSGYFIIGKMTSENKILLTAFKVLKRQVLFVPRNVIHSNDYLRGTWRTMLSDAAAIDHVHLVQPSDDHQMKHFNFTFNTAGLL